MLRIKEFPIVMIADCEGQSLLCNLNEFIKQKRSKSHFCNYTEGNTYFN